jgi:phosphatidylinositol 3-kinase
LEEDEEQVTGPSQLEQDQLEVLFSKPNFSQLTIEEKQEIWRFRNYIKNQAEVLPKFLLSVNWSIDKNIESSLSLMKQWEPCSFDDCVFLLS